MKDSHIGTYGVIALIIYFHLMTQLASLSVPMLCTLFFCGDCWGKFCASQLINFLPYARKEEESKAKVVYHRMNGYERIFNLAGGLLPAILLLPATLWLGFVGSILILAFLVRLMKRRLQGYTGDCCGATFLLCELAFYLCTIILV
jgi:adenosylcobinamide-GDP ribazoletransferase